jgi:hypothetical protein
VVPSSLRRMLLQYFHDGVLAGQMGAQNTLGKSVSNFWWRKEVFDYARKCELCQRAKPAQNARGSALGRAVL